MMTKADGGRPWWPSEEGAPAIPGLADIFTAIKHRTHNPKEEARGSPEGVRSQSDRPALLRRRIPETSHSCRAEPQNLKLYTLPLPPPSAFVLAAS